jgi:hypothetical protein
MRMMTFSLVALFLIVSPLHADPLVWTFTGTTAPGSQFGGGMLQVGLRLELRIFLDTSLVGFPNPPGFPQTEVTFGGPFSGEVDIETLPVRLPLDSFSSVQTFGSITNNVLSGAIFRQPSFNDVLFDPFSTDIRFLTPIPPRMTTTNNGLSGVTGPGGLFVNATVNTFSAVLVPEGGSTAVFLTSGLAALAGLLRPQKKRRD